ncbi:MAG: hypothetical protein C4523_01265 [Myxococcales bacterium]|nr:MAG: hypothetical protein C4523_01265 [Myxococcales bacterium]
MKRFYPILTTLSTLPLAAYCLVRRDLRAGVMDRFLPRAVETARTGSGPRLWVHAASAGEVALGNYFMEIYRREQPSAEFLLTTNTASGLSAAAKGPWSATRRFPFDAHFALARLFASFAPTALVLVEQELWPGLLEMARTRGVPAAVVNARLPERSISRYRELDRRFDGILSHPIYLTRNDADLANLAQAGVPVARMIVHGEMKVDAMADRLAMLGLSRLNEPIVLAISTHRGEETVLLDALGRLRVDYPEARLIIAPRHARRASHVARLAARYGFAATLAGEGGRDSWQWADVVVEDRFGRMAEWLSMASVAFVGGSLVPRGGHNVCEPILAGVPALVGPHHANWEGWVRILDEANGLSVVENAADVARVAAFVFDQPQEIRIALHRARSYVKLSLGATARNVAAVRRLEAGGDPFATEDG